MKRAWKWVCGVVGIALAGLAALLWAWNGKRASARQAEESARDARLRAEGARRRAVAMAALQVELADRKAAEEVANAKRTGGLADHLRNDGAGS